MPKEGVIKFTCVWKKSGPLPLEVLKDLNFWRRRLFETGLIGQDRKGLGFGNISSRIKWPKESPKLAKPAFFQNQFIITGSQTGRLRNLDGNHYTKVLSYDFVRNSLVCEGPIKASSESLTHAAVYESDPQANAVIHVHSMKMWKALFGKVPTTSRNAQYGTPEMAYEIIRLFRKGIQGKILVMGGHESGLLSFGKDINVAGNIMMDNWRRFR